MTTEAAIVARGLTRRFGPVLAGTPEVTDLETFGERLHATLSRTPREEAPAAAERLRAALGAAGVEVEVVRPVLPSLEDIFISRIRGRA